MSDETRRRRRQFIRELQKTIRGLLLVVLIETAVIILLLVRLGNDTEAAQQDQPTPQNVSACVQTLEVVSHVPAETPVAEIKAEEEKPKYLHIEAVPLSFELQEVMQQACEEYGVPYSLALAIAERESTFALDADNGICYGVMQIHSINYERLRGLGIEPTEHEGNIVAGVFMIGELLEKYGDTHKALMAYNCGESGAARLWEQGYSSSQYSRQVVSLAEEWQQIINGN